MLFPSVTALTASFHVVLIRHGLLPLTPQRVQKGGKRRKHGISVAPVKCRSGRPQPFPMFYVKCTPTFLTGAWLCCLRKRKGSWASDWQHGHAWHRRWSEWRDTRSLAGGVSMKPQLQKKRASYWCPNTSTFLDSPGTFSFNIRVQTVFNFSLHSNWD